MATCMFLSDVRRLTLPTQPAMFPLRSLDFNAVCHSITCPTYTKGLVLTWLRIACRLDVPHPEHFPQRTKWAFVVAHRVAPHLPLPTDLQSDSCTKEQFVPTRPSIWIKPEARPSASARYSSAAVLDDFDPFSDGLWKESLTAPGTPREMTTSDV